MRRIRNALQLALPVLGMVVVFGGILMVPPTNLRLQLMVVLAGVLILEAGVWGLTDRILPSERQYGALREEGDRFIGLIRKLNVAAVSRNGGTAGGEATFQDALSVMHGSVDLMGEVAGEEG